MKGLSGGGRNSRHPTRFFERDCRKESFRVAEIGSRNLHGCEWVLGQNGRNVDLPHSATFLLF